MATAVVKLGLDTSAFSAGIRSAQAGITKLSSGITGAARIGSRGLIIAGVAALGLSTALVVGVKKAFDLGGSLADISAISGKSVKNLLLMRRALEDAGISAEKIDRFFLTGQDRGGVIAKAMKNLSAKDWKDAAASVGKQADILDKSSAKFDRVSDLLGRSGDKLQGFFVGVADKISSSILPMLEKFDKVDLSGIGQKFGDGLVKGAEALAGLFDNPKLLVSGIEAYLSVAMLNTGNVLIAAFKSGIVFFKDGMSQAVTGIGEIIAATVMAAFEKPIAFFAAGILTAIDKVAAIFGEGSDFDIGIKKSKIERAKKDYAVLSQTPGWGQGTQGKRIKDAKKKEISDMEAEMEKSIKAGAKTGMSFDQHYNESLREGRKTVAKLQAAGSANIVSGVTGAINAAKGFKVEDVLGAGAANARAGQITNVAIARGKKKFDAMFGTSAQKTMGEFGSSRIGFGGTHTESAQGLRAGGLGGTASSYHLIRRGDAARARAGKQQDPHLKALKEIKDAVNKPDWADET